MEVQEDIALSRQDNGTTKELNLVYTQPGNLTESPYGDGGYVFTFDKRMMTDKVTGISIDEVSKIAFEQIGVPGIAIIDWVMYNPNHDVYIYASMEYLFRSNGAFETNFRLQLFQRYFYRTNTAKVLAIAYIVLFVYYVVVLITHLIFEWK